MSSTADSQDTDLPTSRGSKGRRTPWEIEELASAGILSALSVLALFYLAAGWATSDENFGSGASQRLRLFLLYSTGWSGVFAALFVLLALGLVWWEIQGWTERLADLDNEDGNEGTIDEFDEAVQHLLRNRSLSTGCAVLLAVGLLASVGAVVGTTVAEGDTGVVWSQVLGPTGQLFGFLILTTVGVVAIVRLRATCKDALSIDDAPTPDP